MTKNKNWHKVIVLLALVLTIYNVLPTILYYSKSLNDKVGPKEGKAIINSISERVDNLEEESLSWIKSFNSLLGIKAKSISIDNTAPQLIKVVYDSQQQATTFKSHLPKAGNLIVFYPSRLSLSPLQVEKHPPLPGEKITNEYIVFVERKIPISLTKGENFFSYFSKLKNKNEFSPEYKNLLQNRLEAIIYSICSASHNAELLELATSNSNQSQSFLISLCNNLLKVESALSETPALKKIFFKSLTLGYFKNPENMLKTLVLKIQESIKNIQTTIQTFSTREQNTEVSEKIESLNNAHETLKATLILLQNEKNTFISDHAPLARTAIHTLLNKTLTAKTNQPFSFNTSNYNPIVQNVLFDPSKMSITLEINTQLLNLQNTLGIKKNKLQEIEQLIFSEIAKIKQESNEEFKKTFSNYSAQINNLSKSSSVIKLDLEQIKKKNTEYIKDVFSKQFNPSHQDLKKEGPALISYKDFEALPLEKKPFQFVLLTTQEQKSEELRGFNISSIYIIAKDMAKGIQSYSGKQSKKAKEFMYNIQEITSLLEGLGFNGFLGSTPPLNDSFSDDVIFELSDYYQPVIMATRESFHLSSNKNYAELALSTNKERLITLNKIEDQIQQDLIKQNEEYNYARNEAHAKSVFDAPKPTKGLIWNNFKLSFRKYFRGNQDRVLKWGLDLSGGKTVHVVLKNNNNKIITDESDIKQGINELYQRVNKLGVSDVSIRQEGSNIAIDFPNDASLSADELVKASTMTFHIVNEKFGMQNKQLAEDTHTFLQEVYNEALVTNQNDINSINIIAYNHLYGQNLSTQNPQPKSNAAKRLYNAGLKLADPLNSQASGDMSTEYSKIASYSLDNKQGWQAKTHPLVICMNNWALEGANLSSVQANYDPSKGNFLSFSVKSSYKNRQGIIVDPQSNLFQWTNLFATAKIGATPYEAYSNGKGWRLAVVLNGRIISDPILEDALKEHGSISGSFTSRQVQKLASDLKAGSLTFKPTIISEQSVSPDLGQKERLNGIKATIIALIAVLVTMIAYYRFSGVIASIALALNLLIIWATLQNLQASVTLAGLAGVILTLGMAVDANVLVFERVREEFEKSQQLLHSLTTGYKKAFSAIFDSNITTVIAAFILLQFDSGPIKGFALTLIIGIASSMFTALFLTRFLLNRWASQNKTKTLKMSKLVNLKNLNFLKYSKFAWLTFFLISIFGFFSILYQGSNLLGIDFTGGFSTTFSLEEKTNDHLSSKEIVTNILKKNSIRDQDFQIKVLDQGKKIKLFLSRNLTENNGPLVNLNKPIASELQTYSYENNPILVWVVSTLQNGGIHLSNDTLATLDSNFSVVSGQMSDIMRNQAIIGLICALLSILIYITFRFEFKFALCATLGLAFDLIATLAFLSLLHLCKVSVQIDLNVIAAFMTIIGYSLNDTIIVFDRIRENMKLLHKSSFYSIINLSLNETFSRTILTSFTTLIVLICLLVFGGPSILGFALIMAIGVVIGTLSTLFIATGLLNFAFKEKNTNSPKKKFILKNGHN